MTVPKTSVGGPTPRAEPNAETEPASPTSGEFDAVLDEKDVKRTGRKKAGRSGAAGADRPVSTEERGGAAERARGRRRSGAGASEAGVREPGVREAGAREAGVREAGAREAGAREAAAEQALRESDLMARSAPREGPGGPTGDLARPGLAGGAAAPDAAGAPDATARIVRVAEQILLAAEVRLHGDGAVEARLQLDLGRLGRMNVALERTAEGQIRVALEPTTAEGRDLLQARGQELANRLEARGLKLQALTVESSGETLLQIEGTAREAAETTAAGPTAAASDSAPGEQAAGREAPQREHSDEEHERRERHEPEPPAEEEDE